MKNLIVLMAVLLSATSFAGATRDLNRGLKKGYVKLQDVKVNHWLENIEAELGLSYDFGENVSYVYEDIDEVIDDCGFKTHDNMDVYDQITADEGHKVVWKKAVKRKKSRAYVAFLVVPVIGPTGWNSEETFYKTCDVIRGAYAVDRKGKDITDSITIDLERFYK